MSISYAYQPGTSPTTDPESQVAELDLEKLASDIVGVLAEWKQRYQELARRNSELVTAWERVNAELAAALEQTNRATLKSQYLEARTAQLVVALEEANQRAATLEQAAATNYNYTSKALRSAAQTVSPTAAESTTHRPLPPVDEFDPSVSPTRSATIVELRPAEARGEARRSLLSLAQAPIPDPRPANPDPVESSECRPMVPVQTEVAPAPRSMPTTAAPANQPTISAERPVSAMVRDTRKLTHVLARLTEETPSVGPRSSQPTMDATTMPGEGVQSIELTASPFRDVASLRAFHQALRQVPGVVDIRPRGFDQGTLRATVAYAGSMPLAGRLLELSPFDLQITAADDHHIQILVLEPAS